MSAPPWSAILLALAWFGFVNAALSLLALSFSRTLLAHARHERLLFRARLMAAAGATLFAGTVFLPAHWRFEPLDARDSFGASVYLLAAVGLAILLRAVYRSAQVGVAVRRLRRSIGPDVGGMHGLSGFQGVALAGIWRPRIVVGEAAKNLLSPAELQLAVAHEAAHRNAYDNVKRVAMFCAPDLFFWTAAARSLERAWHAAVEELADARAASGDPTRAADLAAALVKVARLGDTAPIPRPLPAWSALHDPRLLETRVRRLLDVETPSAPSVRPIAPSAVMFLAMVGAFCVAGASSPMLHDLTEWLVRNLP